MQMIIFFLVSLFVTVLIASNLMNLGRGDLLKDRLQYCGGTPVIPASRFQFFRISKIEFIRAPALFYRFKTRIYRSPVTLNQIDRL